MNSSRIISTFYIGEILWIFFGGIKELEALKNMYLDKGLTGAIIYGRRRFGKSTLIKESIKYFEGLFIYFQCLKALDIVNAQEGNTIFMDDFLIYQDLKPANYAVFANDNEFTNCNLFILEDLYK